MICEFKSKYLPIETYFNFSLNHTKIMSIKKCGTYVLSQRLMCDTECILNGTFAPLTGFMTKDDYESVVFTNHLSSSELWTIPIVLPISIELSECTHLYLQDEFHRTIACMTIQDVYTPNYNAECAKVYGTLDTNHPYVELVQHWKKEGFVYAGGSIERVNEPLWYDFKDLRYTPDELRQWFDEHDWNTILGFQTRNPMHRCHVELTLHALSQVDNNANLLIHPIVGITQDTDVDYATRIKCYQHILPYYKAQNIRAKLALLPLSMRMAGPREAVWHALIRQNYGCTHFVVGRDHAGPSTKKESGEPFYGPYEAQELLTKYADEMDIKPVFSEWIVYDAFSNTYIPISQSKSVPKRDIQFLSGTELRNRLMTNKDIPTWFSYPEIVKELRASSQYSNSGLCVYLVGLSGSGKTTIANALSTCLKEHTSKSITILDGDIVRTHLSNGLGFSKEDRSINVRRIGYVASEIVKHGGIVICANIAPYEEDRLFNRDMIQQHGVYIQVWCNTHIDICEQRDVKGLYKLARMGKIKQFTGIDDPFETPRRNEIQIDNGKNTIYHNVQQILKFIFKPIDINCIESPV